MLVQLKSLEEVNVYSVHLEIDIVRPLRGRMARERCYAINM